MLGLILQRELKTENGLILRARLRFLLLGLRPFLLLTADEIRTVLINMQIITVNGMTLDVTIQALQDVLSVEKNYLQVLS